MQVEVGFGGAFDRGLGERMSGPHHSVERGHGSEGSGGMARAAANRGRPHRQANRPTRPAAPTPTITPAASRTGGRCLSWPAVTLCPGLNVYDLWGLARSGRTAANDQRQGSPAGWWMGAGEARTAA